MEDARAAMSDETAQAAQLLSAAVQRADTAEHQVAALEHAKAAMSDAVAEAAQQVSVATQRAEAAEQQIAAMEDAKAAASDEKAHATQQLSAALQRTQAAELQISELEQRLAQLKTARQEETQRGESAKADELAALQRQISAQTKAHEKAFNELHALAEQWVTHAKDLKQRLGVSNDRLVFVDARSTGEVALIRRLATELERFKPDHELISREAQQKLISSTMGERLAQKGYQYDPATAAISKK
jgi:chromosome segregation ATPase